ncbi:hypothetical protein SaSA201_0892 [Streptococcus agalactiae]|nr:hypothetical protein SaSA20_0863a [Streptococcus agalactiae]AUO80443.1 hypothetical protein SaSA30_0894 [Streptococcus agalactiae]AUO82031.1 hypothetical protein SaSA33_0893 [Streptococcus agalactiae]AUO85317.1 hypothetical protein SaSA73_0893 [Streptococcus agalactiae]AUO86941.1 hypothetical protein SaSA1_0896 [Streptococcus agalactiae]
MKLREMVKIFFDFLSLCFINTLVILIFLIDNRIHIQFLVPKPMLCFKRDDAIN